MSNNRKLATVIIPTIYAPPTIAATIHTFQHQTVELQIQIIDTGTALRDYTPWRNNIQKLTKTNASRITATRPEHPSHVLAAAIDLGCQLADTPYVILTHDDVWLNHRNVISELLNQMWREATPIIGYEMSPRDHVTDEWKGMISHTLTIIELEWMRTHNLKWDMSQALPPNWKGETKPGWPDTETAFGRALKAINFRPTFIGHETNDLHYQDNRITHRRSLTSHRLYSKQISPPDLNWINTEINKAMEM